MNLTKEQRSYLAELINRGEDLPADYQHLLFPPQRREYELVYANKEREEDIIANTMAVPLQPVSTFGDADAAWHNRLIFGDNLQAMANLLEEKKAGKLCNADGTPGVRLVYIDPPFATKQEFRGSQDQKAYQDKVTGSRFLEFMRQRIVMIHELLSNDGFLVLHIDYRFGHYLKVLIDEIFPGGFRNDIKVPRGTKNVQNQFEKIMALTVGDDSLLLYAKSSQAKLPHLRVKLDEEADGKWDTFWRGTDRPTMRYSLLGQQPTTGQWRWKKSRALEAVDNYQFYLDNYSKTQSLDEYYLKHDEEARNLNFLRLTDDNVVQYYIPPRNARIANTVWTGVRTLGKVTAYPTEKHEELLYTLMNWLSSCSEMC